MKTSPASFPVDDFLLNPKEAARKLGYQNRGSVYLLVRNGRLPPPIRITQRKVGWRNSDLNKFLESCVTDGAALGAAADKAAAARTAAIKAAKSASVES